MKPIDKLKWAALDENDPITLAPNKRKPSEEFELSGLKREEPLFRDHINWALNNVGLWIEYLDTVNSTITVDTIIYVATTGSDVTGDGTILNPYATPQTAVDSLIGAPISTTVTVTILCQAGTYNFTTPLIINYPYGERLRIVGADMLGVLPSGVPESDWTSDKLNPTVPARGVDEFYNTSGSLSTAANDATRKAALASDLTNNTALLETRFATIFKFTDSSGIQVQGSNSLGLLDKILFEGDWDGSDAAIEEHYGIECGESLSGTVTEPETVTGGAILVGNDTAVVGFRGDGFRVRYNSSISCKDGVASVNNLKQGFRADATANLVADKATTQGNLQAGFLSINNAFIRANESISSGNILTGFQAQTGSTLRAISSKSFGNGDSGYILSVNSSGSLDSIEGKGNASNGLSVVSGSSCDGDSAYLSDNNADGLSVQLATFDGSSLTLQNNGGIGVLARDNAGVSIPLSTIQNNTAQEVFATRNSSIVILSGTIPSGSDVFSEKNSYIASDNTAGVTYDPVYGVVGNTEAVIST